VILPPLVFPRHTLTAATLIQIRSHNIGTNNQGRKLYLLRAEVMNRKDDPVAIRPHQLGQRAALLLVVSQPLQEPVLVNLPDEERTDGKAVGRRDKSRMWRMVQRAGNGRRPGVNRHLVCRHQGRQTVWAGWGRPRCCRGRCGS
jgi:hypothetical protein